jgi:uncharacterized repeat protein (TIGR03803 family)
VPYPDGSYGTVTTLATFNGANGAYPYAGLIADAAGNLYGTASYGGANDDGTVFEIKAGSDAVTTLATFNGANGSSLSASLIFDAAGNLYGTTQYGGANNVGTVFEIKAGSDAVTTLTSETGSDASLIFDAVGNLYGTSRSLVFELSVAPPPIVTLATSPMAVNGLAANLGSAAAGTGSEALKVTLISDADFATGSTLVLNNGTLLYTPGQLITAANAGSDTISYTVTDTVTGAVTERTQTVALGSADFTTLVNFNGTNGSTPYPSLIFDAAGNLYGTTQYGGANDDGTVFEIKAGSDAVTSLVTFNGNNGAVPEDNLIVDSAGNLYGTAVNDGPLGGGLVFEIKAGGGAVTALDSFSSSGYQSPAGNLVADAAGNLYGTTLPIGAVYGQPPPPPGPTGEVFEVQAGSGVATVLAAFQKSTGYGVGELVADAAGNLYGVQGGDSSTREGMVFEIKAGSDAVTTFVTFGGSNGTWPVGLTIDAAGNLYGTTQDGNPGTNGAVYEIKGGILTILYPHPL